jgi:hypothetical protein
MLCISLNNYSAPCTTTVGGVNRGWIFDPNDFNFTAGANNAQGQPTGYSTIGLRVGSSATFGTVITVGNVVTSVPVTSGGTNYPFATIPLTFTGGGGTGASGVANVVGGVIVSVTVTSGGSGYTTPPTAQLSTSGATLAGGARMYPFSFYENTGEYTFDNPSADTCSTKYSHTLVGQILNIGQDLTNYLASLSQAGCCCGLGVIFELNNSKVMVMGEKFVGNVEQRRFKIKMSSKGGSGKKYEDFNGADVTLAGDFTRPLFEFTGGVPAILAFQ